MIDGLSGLPDGWRAVPATAAASEGRDKVGIAEFAGRSVVHYSIPNIEEYGGPVVESGDTIASDKLRLAGGELLISRLNPRKGRVLISRDHEELAVCSGEFVVLTPRTNLDLRFGYYVFTSEYARQTFDSEIRSVTRSHQRAPKEAVSRLTIPLPPIELQRAIAGFLDRETGRIDVLVEKKRRLIELLEERRTALISHVVTKGLDPTVPMKDSGIPWLGDVPGQWQVTKLKYVTRIDRGRFGHRPRNDPELYDGPYPFIQTGDIAQAGRYVRRHAQTLNTRGLSESRLFPRGTIVMAIAANVADVSELSYECAFPDSVVGFNTDVPSFAYHVLTSLRAALLRTSTENTQLNTNIERIGTQSVAWPPLDQQQLIGSHLDRIETLTTTLVEHLSRQLDLLAEYRQALITAAVTGQIDVDAEIPEPEEVLA